MKCKNVLSLFDGLSGGQISLNRLGIEYDNYYASEIKPHAIKVCQHHYPNTIQLGDITKIDCSELPDIDLLIGGSPCQSFSRSGDGSGFDGSSKLFWEYIRILKEVKPKYFLLENVIMRKEWEDIITEAVGVEPFKINSKLVSGQNRPRQYWTNIPGVIEPEDKKIYLKDVLGLETDKNLIDGIDKIDIIEKVRVRKYQVDIKALQTLLKENRSKTYKEISKELGVKKTTVDHWFRSDSSFSIPESEYWNKLKICLDIEDKSLDESITTFIERDSVFDMSNRVYRINGKSPTLTASGKKIRVIDDNDNIALLSVSDFEKLQTLPEGYTDILSNNQAMNLIGDGWTIDIIVHIFSFIKD